MLGVLQIIVLQKVFLNGVLTTKKAYPIKFRKLTQLSGVLMTKKAYPIKFRKLTQLSLGIMPTSFVLNQNFVK